MQTLWSLEREHFFSLIFIVAVVQLLSSVWLLATPWAAAHQPSLCLWLTPEVCSNSCLLFWWCHPTTSSSVAPFSCCQSFLASVSFPVSWLFTSGGQSIGASASASVLSMSIQGWFPLRLSSLISLLSKGLLRLSSGTTAWNHQFFSTMPSLLSRSHNHTWLLGRP